MTNVTTKIHVKHLIDQLYQATKNMEYRDPAGAPTVEMALDAWSGGLEDREDQVMILGDLVCDLLISTIDHYESHIDDLNETIEELECEATSTETLIENSKEARLLANKISSLLDEV